MKPKFALLINASDRTSVGNFIWLAHFLPLWVSELTILLFMRARIVGTVTGLKSALTGKEADGIIVSVGLSPRMLKFCFGGKKTEKKPDKSDKKKRKKTKKSFLATWAKNRIINAILFAKAQGATHIALTGQIGGGVLAQAIIEECKADPRLQGIHLTSGNGLTAAEGAKTSIERVLAHGLDPREITVCIVGCYGSLGAAIAKLLARGFWLPEGVSFRHFLLRGRSTEEATRFARELKRYATTEITTEVLESDDGIPKADLVIVSTNLEGPHLFSRHFKKGVKGKIGAIVGDMAVPYAVDSSVLRDRPDVDVFLGGAVRAPGRNGEMVKYGFNFGMDPGLCFACMAEIETAALDDAAIRHLTHTANINPDDAVALLEIAMAHGFDAVARRSTPRKNPWAFWRKSEQP